MFWNHVWGILPKRAARKSRLAYQLYMHLQINKINIDIIAGRSEMYMLSSNRVYILKKQHSLLNRAKTAGD